MPLLWAHVGLELLASRAVGAELLPSRAIGPELLPSRAAVSMLALSNMAPLTLYWPLIGSYMLGKEGTEGYMLQTVNIGGLSHPGATSLADKVYEQLVDDISEGRWSAAD